MDKWMKDSLEFHYNEMVKLFNRYGYEPFDLHDWLDQFAYSYDDEMPDDGVYNFLPYLRQVEISTGKKEKVSTDDLVDFLNCIYKDPDEMDSKEYDLYTRLYGKAFSKSKKGVYVQQVTTCYQFVTKPTLKATFKNWE